MDTFKLGNKEFKSRFILGSGKFNLELIKASIKEAEAEIVTLALRRANTNSDDNILNFIPDNVTLLPNTSGARTADEAVRIAKLARELSGSDFIKVEIINDSKFLFPDNEETIKATEILSDLGFYVMPYVTSDLVVAKKLEKKGAVCVMPLASPIGSNMGLVNKDFIQILINEIDLPVIVDAGIGKPSDACKVMEMGATACMINTAVATSSDIPQMARAFKLAIDAGRSAYLSGLGRVLDKGEMSSPDIGFLR